MQAAAAAERPRRNVPVAATEGAIGILGQACDTAAIERNGLVPEAAHADDRQGIAAEKRIDFEHVTVRLADRLELFLAREPSAPRRRPACAIRHCSREADGVADEA